MISKTVLVLATILMAVAFMGTFTEPVYAQADDQVTGDTANLKTTDQGLSQKRSVEDSLANRELGGEDSKKPTRFQMGLGLGSCIVMVIVVKWL